MALEKSGAVGSFNSEFEVSWQEIVKEEEETQKLIDEVCCAIAILLPFVWDMFLFEIFYIYI